MSRLIKNRRAHGVVVIEVRLLVSSARCISGESGMGLSFW